MWRRIRLNRTLDQNDDDHDHDDEYDGMVCVQGRRVFILYNRNAFKVHSVLWAKQVVGGSDSPSLDLIYWRSCTHTLSLFLLRIRETPTLFTSHYNLLQLILLCEYSFLSFSVMPSMSWTHGLICDSMREGFVVENSSARTHKDPKVKFSFEWTHSCFMPWEKERNFTHFLRDNLYLRCWTGTWRGRKGSERKKEQEPEFLIPVDCMTMRWRKLHSQQVMTVMQRN